MPVVVGFTNEYLLQCHFRDHGRDFGAVNKEDYFSKAKIFFELDRAVNPNILECVKRNGDIVRFNPITDEFGVIGSNGRIKSYYKPLPDHLAPPGTPKYLTHPHPNNLTYFRQECRR